MTQLSCHEIREMQKHNGQTKTAQQGKEGIHGEEKDKQEHQCQVHRTGNPNT